MLSPVPQAGEQISCEGSVTQADAEDHYAIRLDADGTWTVYDVSRRQPAEINGLRLVNLNKVDAEEFMALLNWVHARRDVPDVP